MMRCKGTVRWGDGGGKSCEVAGYFLMKSKLGFDRPARKRYGSSNQCSHNTKNNFSGVHILAEF
jgi:hypothetical protein